MEKEEEKSSHHNRPAFGLFAYLSDDLKHHIISFVADAPLEEMPENYPTSALTHYLPAVSKKFNRLSKHDFFWRKAIARQTAREPFLWRKALFSISQKGKTPKSVVFQRRHADRFDGTDEELIVLAHSAMGKPSYKSIYQNVVSNHLRFKGPVLCMPGQIQLGHPYEINSDEKLFYAATERIMSGHPREAREGGPIDSDAIFVHANRGPLARSTPAVLVQVLRCEFFHEEKRAHVVLLPFAHVWLEKLWLCPKTRDVIYTQALKMTKGVSADMNRLARQEALAFIMDRLAGEVLENNFFDELLEEDSDDSSVGSSDDSSSIDSQDSFVSVDNNEMEALQLR